MATKRRDPGPRIFYVFERLRYDGDPRCIYGPIERKLADHVARKSNQLRRPDAVYPFYDVWMEQR